MVEGRAEISTSFRSDGASQRVTTVTEFSFTQDDGRIGSKRQCMRS